MNDTSIKLTFGSIKYIQFLLFIVLAGFTAAISLAQDTKPKSILLHATRIFDGDKFRTNVSVLITDGYITQVDSRELFQLNSDATVINLGDATLLPGFIELHAHLSYQKVPVETVLKHGITTIRDVGGPVHQPYGGNGNLRVLTSGPIITAPNGYPIPILGDKDIAITASSEEEARKVVRELINQGSIVIKIALEPGGEKGAPWSAHHDHHHEIPNRGHNGHHNLPKHTASHSKQTWPLLSEEIVKAIVDEAHKNDRRVTAHIAEIKGAQIAIDAGIDEWAHIPCEIIPDHLLKKAVSQNVKIISTFDTLSKCIGVSHNASTWAALGGKFLYGSEIAHPDIPWGIDAQELIYMRQMAKMDLIEVLQAATSKAGQHLNIPFLGTLQPGAPADIIAIKGNPTDNLKKLEYPDLVISGGKIIVNNF
ncbi:amidohydrolase family protein [Nitrosomonas sp. Is37]|uniref:amidohydrolase family protein n=1 Tax=Nitrosomonas sp. Is37 TaxID=3080535 RepID=UPI00294AFDE6|nr:amidohydrolase family protein [Nitrosomonas sp. Is37]MDV6343417.1 amidohydrolase family protein [Nitrosomonas sp. Is37]